MKKYFANESTKEIGKHLMDRIEDYREFLRNSGMLDQLRKSYNLYYGNSYIQDVGGGKVGMQTNHYASLAKAILSQTTSTRPAFDAKAINSDHESMAHTQLANALLDYYLRQKRLEDHLKKATELAIFLREGWILCEWQVSGGEIYAINPENDQPIYTGDVEFKTLDLTQVVRDVKNKSQVNDWWITSEQKNKWDIIAKYPELEQKILAKDTEAKYEDELNVSYNVWKKQVDSDLITVYTFMHRKSEAVSQGRLVQFIDKDIILIDSPLPYKKPYLFKISANDTFQTNFGHSQFFDLMPLQDALDSTISIILTNQNALGVQNITAEKGSAVGLQQISEGLNLIEHAKGTPPPAPLNLLQTSPEVYKFADMIIQQQQVISGVNSVARGEAPASMSGSALALLASQSLTFNGGLSQSYNSLLENVGTALIELLQTYANVPRVAEIVGRSNKSLLKEFSKENISKVTRVVVDQANPLTKTLAGRTELANTLLQSQLIKTPEEYLSVINNGILTPLLEHGNSQNMLIRQENEWLGEGKAVSALMTDDHSLHVLEHSVVLNSPDARLNPEITNTVLTHIMEHISLAKTMDPILAQMLKLSPLQIPAPQAAAPEDVMNNQPPVQTEAENVNMPNMPVDPLSGERIQN